MAESEQFSQFADRGAFFAVERQIHLADLVEGHERWDVDLAAETFTFTYPDRTLVCRPQLLGSSALGPGSWLWAWANPHIPEGVTATARRLQELGEQYGIPELTTGEVPLGDAGNEPPRALWYRLTALSGWFDPTSHGYFRAPTAEGTVAPILLSVPDLQLPALDIPRLARVLGEGVSLYEIADHRLAIAGYAEVRAIPIEWHGRDATLTLASGHLDVTFNDLHRIANISGTATGAGQA